MDFRLVADEVAREIERGALKPGDQLPTQRAFARQRRIAASTAIRVYGELVRRGLVVGEVGRGTFVRAAPVHPDATMAEDSGRTPVNLELNYPVVEGQSELMGRSLTGLLRADALDLAILPAAPDGSVEARSAAARLLARRDWEPDADRVLFAGNSRQAVAAALSSLVRPGSRLAVEELTYAMVKGIAQRLGIELVAVRMDEQGMCPDALAAAHRRTPLSAVYVQPTLHNPLSLTMAEQRRQQLADVVSDLDLSVVEDATWSFLVEDAPPPFAAYAPERTILVDSLSKRLAPGLTTGFLVAPAAHADALAAALRFGAWTAGRFNLEAMVRWAGDGTVARIAAAKRLDVADRQTLVREHLAGFEVRTHPGSYFCWWQLPSPWRAETFTARAARELGIAVTPGSAFATGARTAPDAVRVALASPPRPVLADALRRLAELAAKDG
ncbi:PLP-dependent aminotransferase family protein [Streptomyces sp. CBMA152]|uniref:aminotransferase-like domain-containing protein n=1 Tax=Streptomyces sp. CBMA152 TaxID=1896312 RepID=UPI0016610801|nr:PLP-dependent aminotransferase family protein [Streptomyces sp. CBMA152]MBD0741211.1 GntR family transcriptional regulator [Streptomyces sp. CBMA152]